MKFRMIAAFPGTGLAAYALGALRARPGASDSPDSPEAVPDRDGGVGTHPARPHDRVALLAVGALLDLGLDRVALQTEFGDRLRVQHLAAACDCCVAGPVIRVTLGRLLRAGPFDEVLILVDARTHLEGLERALSRYACGIEREGLMTETQRVLLQDPTRAGHQAALDLVAWAGDGMSFVGPA